MSERKTLMTEAILQSVPLSAGAAVRALFAFALLGAAAAAAAPPDGQILFRGDGILDARATPAFCRPLRTQTGVDVSHITLCNLDSPKCQQISAGTIQGLGILTCPDRVAEVSAPSADTSIADPAETAVTLDAVSMATNLRYSVAGGGSVDAIFCKTFTGGAAGSRACRKVEPGSAICTVNSPIVNFALSAAQCSTLEGFLRSAGAMNPRVDFAILENVRAVGEPGQTAVGVCGGNTVQCIVPGMLEAEGVDYRDITSSQWNQTRTCRYITLDGTRLRRC